MWGPLPRETFSPLSLQKDMTGRSAKEVAVMYVANDPGHTWSTSLDALKINAFFVSTRGLESVQTKYV